MTLSFLISIFLTSIYQLAVIGNSLWLDMEDTADIRITYKRRLQGFPPAYATIHSFSPSKAYLASSKGGNWASVSLGAAVSPSLNPPNYSRIVRVVDGTERNVNPNFKIVGCLSMTNAPQTPSYTDKATSHWLPPTFQSGPIVWQLPRGLRRIRPHLLLQGIMLRRWFSCAFSLRTG